ncbi:hypothetical protein EELLY_v1c07670 [Entomoplasma ellychniae]|uniref:Uncharacterized protein n=1 Tax=Entomoplasma ellychniae TaxID=2114 RepID=A0A8E2QZC2_9MOLU|nr:hypothetical protein [Entomoplasma ellychniae]PPE05079.1 hypothetical protein EELLY_v1c07670 [Entomoplasma ellychniae]
MKISTPQANLISELIQEILILDDSKKIDFLLILEQKENYTIDFASQIIEKLFDEKRELLKKHVSIEADPFLKTSIEKMRQSIVSYNNILDVNRYENFVIFSHIALNRLIVFFMKIYNKVYINSKNGNILDFSILLNELHSIQVINNNQRDKLIELNHQRNNIAHKLPKYSESDLQDNYIFSCCIVEIFNDIIRSYSTSLVINEKIINFQNMYITSNDFINVEYNKKGNSISKQIIGIISDKNTNRVSEEQTKFYKKATEICQMFNQKFSTELDGFKMSASFSFPIVRKSLKLITTKEGTNPKNLEKEKKNLIYNQKFCHLFYDVILYHVDLIDEMWNFFETYKKQNISFDEMIKILRSEQL